MAKLMNRLSKQKINPLIGAAGVSAVPMAARVVSKVGLEANPHNFLLMHAMGPNVAGHWFRCCGGQTDSLRFLRLKIWSFAA